MCQGLPRQVHELEDIVQAGRIRLVGFYQRKDLCEILTQIM